MAYRVEPLVRLSDAEAIIAQKDAEILEQCRINGMGAEREDALLGKVAQQSAALKLAWEALGEVQDLIGESHGVSSPRRNRRSAERGLRMNSEHESLGYVYDLLYDIKTKEQLNNEVDYLVERLSGIAKLCRQDGCSIDAYISTMLHLQKVEPLKGE